MSAITSFHKPIAARTDGFGNDLRRAHEELDHLVRALSHDMSANFMLLESSYSRLKRSLPKNLLAELDERIAHVDACLLGSKQFLDDLVRLGTTGNVEMEPEHVALSSVLDEALYEQREVIERKGCNVRVFEPLPTVWCNRQRVRQILTNLIRNALSHGCDPEHPEITVSGWVAKSPLAGRRIAWLRVHDNGRGIDPRLHEEIFLPGRRLPGVASEGTGMGLAIIRKIAEHYGGAARVEPGCPSGTAMLVSLPAGSSVLQATSSTEAGSRNRDDRRQNVEHDGPHQNPPPLPRQPFLTGADMGRANPLL